MENTSLMELLEKRPEAIEVSSGVLVITSIQPLSCNIGRDLEHGIVWAPKLLVAVPSKENPFVVFDDIRLKNTPFYIKRADGGVSIWYADPDIQKMLRLRGYVFSPGNPVKSDLLSELYVFKKSFVPDANDPNQNREDIHLVGGYDIFDYADSSHTVMLALNTRTGRDLTYAIHAAIASIVYGEFGYDCKFSGTVGLNSRKKGRFDVSSTQIRDAVGEVGKDLKYRLEI